MDDDPDLYPAATVLPQRVLASGAKRASAAARVDDDAWAGLRPVKPPMDRRLTPVSLPGVLVGGTSRKAVQPDGSRGQLLAFGPVATGEHLAPCQGACGCSGPVPVLDGGPDVFPSKETTELGKLDPNTYGPIGIPPIFQGGCRDVVVRPAEPEVLAACLGGTCPAGQNCYGVQVNDNIAFPGSWSGTRFMCSPTTPTDVEIWFLVSGGFLTDGRPFPAGTRIVSVTPYRPAVSVRRVRVCGWEFGDERIFVPPVGYVGPGPMPPR